MAWLFTEYDVARNSQVLLWNFSIPRATSYSVNKHATLQLVFLSETIQIIRDKQYSEAAIEPKTM